MRKAGFTLVEILIVVVIMAILAATIIPQFSESSNDAKLSTLRTNLKSFRSQIELYRNHHAGRFPSATLVELTKATNEAGTIGSGAGYPFGPYMQSIPVNSMTGSSAVTAITASPATSAQTTGTGGWLFNTSTGEIWADHEKHVTE